MHHSIWRPSPSEPLEPLRADAQVDVCVIGAGVAGLTTAYLLARDGRSVLVLNDDPIGGGHAHGVERASLAAASHQHVGLVTGGDVDHTDPHQ